MAARRAASALMPRDARASRMGAERWRCTRWGGVDAKKSAYRSSPDSDSQRSRFFPRAVSGSVRAAQPMRSRAAPGKASARLLASAFT